MKSFLLTDCIGKTLKGKDLKIELGKNKFDGFNYIMNCTTTYVKGLKNKKGKQKLIPNTAIYERISLYIISKAYLYLNFRVHTPWERRHGFYSVGSRWRKGSFRWNYSSVPAQKRIRGKNNYLSKNNNFRTLFFQF